MARGAATSVELIDRWRRLISAFLFAGGIMGLVPPVFARENRWSAGAPMPNARARGASCSVAHRPHATPVLDGKNVRALWVTRFMRSGFVTNAGRAADQ